MTSTASATESLNSQFKTDQVPGLSRKNRKLQLSQAELHNALVFPRQHTSRQVAYDENKANPTIEPCGTPQVKVKTDQKKKKT